VIVPVLSKQHTSTCPAKGIRNGSVQKMALDVVRGYYARLVEGIDTVFGKSNERSVNSKGKFHRQLRRHNACNNKNAIEKKLGFLEVSLNTCQVFHLDHKEVRVRICQPLTQTYQLAAIAKMRRNPMKRNDSMLFAEIRSVEKIMVLTS
jgi:hypothetical protein